ncbi:SMI1/KNR4 family protein [Chryseobacterium mucoviscidosis]|uniref:SMI1/KNR4 family protein n=1 Tax=Paenibacillus TaxID=44249 RepID=UPI0009A294FE|nr:MULTISPECIES: SMI1/KNR4 family protein [Paenibacillus]MDN8593526.1 SMI1/KNR4 family protein [Paenibacillus sp. 11B]OPG95210.1 SMI1/KNR4 family protein [Chryseobacterium mucoviscidosis]OZQ57722.1 SMI1/KNR4 family protein [Paenibacillus taichungensis]
MVQMDGSHEPITLKEINEFQRKFNLNFTEQYIKFLLESNGGDPSPSMFKISDEQGAGVLNIFYGIGDMYSNLEEYIDIYEYRLPTGFIPIGNDPSGNVICLGLNEKYYNNIYFWDHEQESENPDDMRNMYFLANDLNEFLDSLYDDEEE